MPAAITASPSVSQYDTPKLAYIVAQTAMKPASVEANCQTARGRLGVRKRATSARSAASASSGRRGWRRHGVRSALHVCP